MHGVSPCFVFFDNGGGGFGVKIGVAVPGLGSFVFVGAIATFSVWFACLRNTTTTVERRFLIMGARNHGDFSTLFFLAA